LERVLSLAGYETPWETFGVLWSFFYGVGGCH
jgi:hypothetical protein